VSCHAKLDDALRAPVDGWRHDVHQEAGLACESCHGGDPAPALIDDPEAAMSAAAGFRPAPDRREIPEFCGKCHADADYMKRFDPQARVDQLAEYRTSRHGIRNAQGDPVPATCVDCHGAHGIRGVDSPDSPVYARNVPGTCARCHADASVMGAYGISTDPYPDYMASVHAAALLDRADNAAPACNDCHGNHGATPPGVQSVANVCGQCHGREAALFRSSFKKELFDMLEVAECVGCHENHRIRHPSSEMFRSGSAPQLSAGTITSLHPFGATLENESPAQSVWAEWSMVLAPHLEPGDPGLAHVVRVETERGRLEIDATVAPGDVPAPNGSSVSEGGMSARLTIDPMSGSPVRAGDALRYRLEIATTGPDALPAVRVGSVAGAGLHVVEGSVCLTCHSLGDECDQATEEMYAALSETRRSLRTADTELRAVERAGMDVGDVLFKLGSEGQTAAVEASALIHSFDPGRVVERAEEGEAVATSALEAAAAARAEIQFRRRGLAISLVLIALVLLGLYLKIREIDRVRVRQRLEASD
jgi:hypothetical protein